MEKVIGMLFEIEKKANQIIERANIEKNQLSEDNEEAIAAMEAKIATENNEKIKVIMAKAEKDIEMEKQQLIEASDKQLRELEDTYKKNHDALVDKVFNSIIQI